MDCNRVGDLIFVPSLDFGRMCVRCAEPVHPTDPPHLCADVLAGLHEQNQRDWVAFARDLVVLGGEG